MGKCMLLTNLDCGDVRSFCMVSASVGAVDDALLDGLWKTKHYNYNLEQEQKKRRNSFTGFVLMYFRHCLVIHHVKHFDDLVH